MDKLFQVRVLAQTPDPQTLIYAALHQDYSEDFVWNDRDSFPSEQRCGEIAVDRLLKGGRGHFGVFEHPQISFNCGYFPHSVVQQGRTHRIGTTWDVESMRYSGKRVVDVTKNKRPVEDVFYLRPAGEYTDRKGEKYTYTREMRNVDIEGCLDAAYHYRDRVGEGLSEEHARGMLPFDYRQHFVVSFNTRSLMHFLDLRSKKDAQLEIQQLCELMWSHFEVWMPEIAQWYKSNRLGKGRLAP